MIRRISILAVIALCACSTPTQKSNVVRPPMDYAHGPGPYAFDCDTESGHFKTLNIKVPGDALKIVGSVRLLASMAQTPWRPTMTVSLVLPDKRSNVALVAYVSDDNVMLVSLTQGRPQSSVFAQMQHTTSTIRFAFTTDHAGNVRASIAGLAAPLVTIKSSIERVMLSCSSAHAEFSDVSISAFE
jgi:hypothetical protein